MGSSVIANLMPVLGEGLKLAEYHIAVDPISDCVGDGVKGALEPSGVKDGYTFAESGVVAVVESKRDEPFIVI
jgi:hypothetical protein